MSKIINHFEKETAQNGKRTPQQLPYNNLKARRLQNATQQKADPLIRIMYYIKPFHSLFSWHY